MENSFTVLVVKEIVLPDFRVIPIDTPILVDTQKMIGFWDNEHFDVFPDEFIHLN